MSNPKCFFNTQRSGSSFFSSPWPSQLVIALYARGMGDLFIKHLEQFLKNIPNLKIQILQDSSSLKNTLQEADVVIAPWIETNSPYLEERYLFSLPLYKEESPSMLRDTQFKGNQEGPTAELSFIEACFPPSIDISPASPTFPSIVCPLKHASPLRTEHPPTHSMINIYFICLLGNKKNTDLMEDLYTSIRLQALQEFPHLLQKSFKAVH